ncbi:MAG: HEAT repeat domain-containing protein [Myxococcaceae bacterium]|nr:MAG: HEAT repeat domain-containing protein [Myxococcaceae bacterium]
MGILDIFGGKSPERATKLRAKVVQKYGGPEARQKAIQQLGEMEFPEATASLLARFTVAVEPATTDTDEKEHVFGLIRSRGEAAVDPVRTFLRRNDQASSWAVRLLRDILPADRYVTTVVEHLRELGEVYTRDPEKKLVLLHEAESLEDSRIAPTVLPLLEDMADDVKIGALRVLGPRAYAEAREPMLKLLTAAETARRVQAAAVEAIARSGFGVQGYREKVESLLPEPFFVDKAGILKRRGVPAPGQSE